MKYHTYDQLINNNQKWKIKKLESDQDYFKNLSRKQKPPFLYIGCSDSRLPVDTFTQTQPGELFIHRNVANQVSLTDMNILSVIQYAVEVLQVEHIIVCGHYGCGGVEAAYSDTASGLVENWITPIKDLSLRNKEELDKIDVIEKRIDRLSEINVIAQVENICKTSILQKSFENYKYPELHGWILDIFNGSIKELELPIEEWKNIGLLPENYNESLSS